MGRRLSDVTTKVLSLLEDGKWHSEEAVLVKAMTAVPPNIAFRHAERARAHSVGVPLAELKPRTRGDDNVAIRSGQRAKTRASILSLLESQRIERDIVDGKPMLRLRQGIPHALFVRAENAAAVYYKQGDVNVIEINLDPWPPPPDQILEMLTSLNSLPNSFPGRRKLVQHLRQALKEHGNDQPRR